MISLPADTSTMALLQALVGMNLLEEETQMTLADRLPNIINATKLPFGWELHARPR